MNGGYVFSFHSKRHERKDFPAVVASECCHNTYLLPDGSAVQVVTSGRRHYGTMTISFTDDSGRPCDAADWGARSPLLASAENVAESYSCGGLLIKFSKCGRRASASFNVYSALDKVKLLQCRKCYCMDVVTLQAVDLCSDGTLGAGTSSKSGKSVTPAADSQGKVAHAEGVGICDQECLVQGIPIKLNTLVLPSDVSSLDGSKTIPREPSNFGFRLYVVMW